MHISSRDMRCVSARWHRPRKPLWSSCRPLEETMKSMVTLVAQQGNDPFLLIASLRLIVSLWSNYWSLSRCRFMVLLEGLRFSKVHERWRKLIGWLLVLFCILISHCWLLLQRLIYVSHTYSSIIFSTKVFNLLFPSHLHFIRFMKIINLSLCFPAKCVFATLVAGDV